MLKKQEVVVKHLHGLDETRKEAQHFSIGVAADEEVLVELALEVDAVVPRHEVYAILLPYNAQHGEFVSVDQEESVVAAQAIEGLLSMVAYLELELADVDVFVQFLYIVFVERLFEPDVFFPNLIYLDLGGGSHCKKRIVQLHCIQSCSTIISGAVCYIVANKKLPRREDGYRIVRLEGKDFGDVTQLCNRVLVYQLQRGFAQDDYVVMAPQDQYVILKHSKVLGLLGLQVSETLKNFIVSGDRSAGVGY